MKHVSYRSMYLLHIVCIVFIENTTSYITYRVYNLFVYHTFAQLSEFISENTCTRILIIIYIYSQISKQGCIWISWKNHLEPTGRIDTGISKNYSQRMANYFRTSQRIWKNRLLVFRFFTEFFHHVSARSTANVYPIDRYLPIGLGWNENDIV